MDRRVFLGTLGLNVLAAPLTAQAQRAGKMPLVGVLHTSSPTPGALGPLGPDTPRDLTVSALRLGLRDLGYVEGQTIALEYRFAEGGPETLPRLATELVQLKVDVLVASGPAAIRAARAVTSSIPIVGQDYESDPVQSGFVRSFSRPGGNLTGLFVDLPSLAGKWLELLREAVPGLTRVAALWDPTIGPSQTTATALGLTIPRTLLLRTDHVIE